MRCRNCHTQLMATDVECPSCHASRASATAAAPGAIEQSSGMLKMLPLFGGAIGGLAYAALTSGDNRAPARAPWGPSAPRGPSPLKWMVGLVLMIGGGLLLALAFMQFSETRRIVQREPKVLTATDLCQVKNPALAPGWVEYTFQESQPLDLTVTRQRLGNGGKVQARCLLVRVDDKWLLASVAPSFEGDRLVGRLVTLDSVSSQSLVKQARQLKLKTSALLPYEFNAVDGSASDQQIRYVACAWIAGFGLLGLLPGAYLFRAGRSRPAPSPAVSAPTGLTYQPLTTRLS